MKIFWIVIALLAVVAAVLLLRPKAATTPITPANPTAPAAPTAPAPAPAATSSAGTPDSPAASGPDAAPITGGSSAAATTTTTNPTDPTDPSTPAAQPTIDPTRAAGTTPTRPPHEHAPKPPPAPDDAAARIARQAAAAEKARAISDTLDAVLAGEDPTIPALEDLQTPSAAAGPAGAPIDPAAPAKIEIRPDGSKLIDGRFPLSGSGTKADPYRVTWEMLVSAEQTYQPRHGRKVIPDRLKLIHDKWVSISGYIAFPIMAQSQDEMLMMLNQWDGCCIGVPPTPYDAIEVKLAKLPKSEDRLKVAGSVTGLLKVDPYLVKDWLVSLYIMDDAELSTTQ